MGLAERRAIQAYETEKFPAWKKQIDEAAGYPLSYEIEWATFAIDGQAEQYTNNFDFGYFHPITKALQAICKDQMGKDALKAKVKKVKILNDDNGGYPEAKIEGDTLIVTAKNGYVQTENWTQQGIENITKSLENAL